MANRGGRDRYRRDYPSRSEEKGHHGRNNPPSRHLWVGNLSHSINETTLAHHFLEFGELENVSFQPGRSYAFINYRNDEDAFAAIKELQGFVVAGNPLKIEFTKGEKSSVPPRAHSEYVQHRDQQRSMVRRSPFPQRDSGGVRYSSPDPPYIDNPNSSDQNTVPSEVLWIGFPSQLKVDGFILRKTFSPFGEIDSISAFPGRTYAFVRFRNVGAAIRARNTLQGKLFGNPRVRLCFAKNESGTSNRERNPHNDPPSSHFRGDRHYSDIDGDRSMRSRFVSNLEPNDPHDIDFRRRDELWRDGNGDFEQRRFSEMGSGRGPPENMYEPRNSPPRRDRGPPLRGRGAHFRDYSPLQHPPADQFYDDDDPWDLPEDVSFFHGVKKLKTGSFPPENELPEYPFSASDKSKRVPSRGYIDHPQPEAYDMNLSRPYGDRSDHFNKPYDGFPVSLPSKGDWKRSTSESQTSSRNKEWKWEGTIAKGGTPVCRARCFPVGKMLEMPLPEFIDCTARTSLDMLAKHYYQAASAFVVFFVPADDPDIAYYNEFMNYLGDKQRAAVAKLDDVTTLFLVPPSDFSEKVLKVPGRLSVSGVVLRLDQSGSSQQSDKNHADLTSFYGSGHSVGSMYESIDGDGDGDGDQHEYSLRQQSAAMGPSGQRYHMHPRSIQDNSRESSRRSVQDSPLPPSSMPPVHQTEQLAQLTSSLIGQMRQSTGEDFRHQSENSYRNISSEMSSSQYGGQVQQHQYMGPNIPGQPQKELHQQSVNAGQEEDPQTRLQATLQLAATLLQQIQGKGT